MKTFHSHTTLPKYILSALGLAYIGAAQADVVTFDTEVVQVACTPDLNHSGAPSATIFLPDIRVSALGTKAGDTAGETPFEIDLRACGDKVPAGTLAGAYFYGTGFYDKGSTWTSTTNRERGVFNGRLIGSTSDNGSGWHYQLLPGSGAQQIDVLTSSGKPADAVLAKLPSVDVSSGSGTLNYRVRYYRVHTSTAFYPRGGVKTEDKTPAQVNPGTRTAQVTYVLYYR